MENVILTIHLILALGLVGIVLLQRSEGGGLLGGGGGAGGGVMSARGVGNVLTKVTWILAIAFIGTSIALTIVAAKNSAGASVLDRLGSQPAAVETPALPDATDLLPPTSGDAPVPPPAAD